MSRWLTTAAIFLALSSTEAAIVVPEEVPTLTSIIFSILPPIKLGQDSRFGTGFRLGPNADAQVLLELGPQTNTGSLGPAESPSRRHTPSSSSSSSSSDGVRVRRQEVARRWLTTTMRRMGLRLESESSSNFDALEKNQTTSS